MTRAARREQLSAVARELFATQGFDAVSIEEIAAHAKVSKPVLYEHFGTKDGLYQVIIDRELSALSDMMSSLMAPGTPVSKILEGIVLSLLDYIEDDPDGFRLIAHQSPTTVSSSTFSTVMSDVGDEVAFHLEAHFKSLGFDVNHAPLYGHMLAGAIANAVLWWQADPSMPKEEATAHVINLVYRGLHDLQHDPRLNRPSDN